MYLEISSQPKNYPIKIAKLSAGCLGILSIIALPLYEVIQSQTINPLEYHPLQKLIGFVLLSAMQLLPKLFIHPYIYLCTPLLVGSIYLLISRRVRTITDWVIVVLVVGLSVAIVSYHQFNNFNLSTEKLYNSNLTVSVNDTSGRTITGVKVCAMRYSFQSDHLWVCRTSDDQGKTFFSAKPGVYDLSLGDEDLRKYPNTETKRTSITDNAEVRITIIAQ